MNTTTKNLYGTMLICAMVSNGHATFYPPVSTGYNYFPTEGQGSAAAFYDHLSADIAPNFNYEGQNSGYRRQGAANIGSNYNNQGQGAVNPNPAAGRFGPNSWGQSSARRNDSPYFQQSADIDSNYGGQANPNYLGRESADMGSNYGGQNSGYGRQGSPTDRYNTNGAYIPYDEQNPGYGLTCTTAGYRRRKLNGEEKSFITIVENFNALLQGINECSNSEINECFEIIEEDLLPLVKQEGLYGKGCNGIVRLMDYLIFIATQAVIELQREKGRLMRERNGREASDLTEINNQITEIKGYLEALKKLIEEPRNSSAAPYVKNTRNNWNLISGALGLPRFQ
jgi:hypothetical protein